MGIIHIKSPNLPEFRFEYHPETKKVYSIELAITPLTGEILAFDVPDHGTAINCVNIWIRGYRASKPLGLIKEKAYG